MGVVEFGSIPATMLSSSVAFGASGGLVEQLGGVVRLPARSVTFRSRKSVVISASHKVREGGSSAIQSKVLVALVAAGASFALNAAAPAWPAHAALPFRGGVKVERGATAPQFPGNEGVGNKVGDNSIVRSSAKRGTPEGEAAGGNLVSDNSTIRQASSRGTPLGEARQIPKRVSTQGIGTGTGMEEGRSDAPDGDVASSEDAQRVKNAVGDVAKGAVQSAATKAAQDFATSQLGISGEATAAATQLVTKVVK